MKKRNFICCSLAAVFALSAAFLAACGKKKPDGPDDDGPVNEEPSGLQAVVYPEAMFDPLVPSGYNNAVKTAHDPVIVEAITAKGTSRYYVFGTDNDMYGVPIRVSDDLVYWERAGVAIDGFTDTMSETDVQTMYRGGNAELQEVYDWIRTGTGFDCWTLWAPDVVPAATNTGKTEDGGWWLYSCWTTAFGSSRSIIFKLSSDNVAGPYTYDGVIVRDGGSGNLNEIDPSIFYDADGGMWMTYGSFSSGIGIIELDPATGMRKDTTVDDTTAGANVLNNTNIEGSVVSYAEVDVYDGDIANEEYDESKWTTKGQYTMMASSGALAYNYNMRVWTSDTPNGTYTSARGKNGMQVAGTWTWRHEGDPNVKDLNFFIPGHNDMLTTSAGVNLIAYHARVNNLTDSYDSTEHYLYVSMYDYNSKGQLVLNPNRYAGEKIGLVTESDVLTLTEGKYSVVQIASEEISYYTKAALNYAQDCEFHADGTITGAVSGTWKLYGSHYVYIKLGDIEYYGTAMPAYIRQYDETTSDKTVGHGGLTISAISEPDGNNVNRVVYFNMQF